MDGNLAIHHILRLIGAGFENSNVEDQVGWVLCDAAEQEREGLLGCGDFSSIVEVAGFVMRENREKNELWETIRELQKKYGEVSE